MHTSQIRDTDSVNGRQLPPYIPIQCMAEIIGNRSLRKATDTQGPLVQYETPRLGEEQIEKYKGGLGVGRGRRRRAPRGSSPGGSS